MKTSEGAPKPAAHAREAALDLLLAVTSERRMLAEVERDILSSLGASERARAARLANETLRWAQRADRMIGRHIRQRPPEDVLNALRLGACELHVAGEAAHGVVSSLVSLVRKRTGEQGLARMTNAVLRKIARAEDWEALPVPELPKPLRKRLLATYGKSRVAAMERVHAAAPPLDLSAKGEPQAVAEAVGGTVLPTGSIRLETPTQVSRLPGFEAGDWWVQDAAAALPARLLGAGPMARVLDLCAAPGGKTMQLAASGAEVTALDISDARLATLRENLARTRLSATVVAADALTWTGGPFDAVLLDAPCTATGTIRRHPDLPHAKRDLDLEPLLKLQSDLIDRALGFLTPGGRMIYCTCSLFAEEGEVQIAAAQARHRGLVIDPITEKDAVGLDPAWMQPDGTLRITPESWEERGGIDGFFIARLIRADVALSSDDSQSGSV